MEGLKLHPAFKDAAATITGNEDKYCYGYLITHQAMCELLDIGSFKERGLNSAEFQRRRLAYMGQTIKLTDYLLEEHQLALKSVRGDGYEIVHPRDQTDWAYRAEVKDMRKVMKRGARRLGNVRLQELSDAGRRENTDRINSMAHLKSMVPRLEVKKE